MCVYYRTSVSGLAVSLLSGQAKTCYLSNDSKWLTCADDKCMCGETLYIIINANWKQAWCAAWAVPNHGYNPRDIDIELRIYQSNDVLIEHPDLDDIAYIMDKIILFDKRINEMKE